MDNIETDNLIINKCLIIDNRFDEVKDIILKLNEKAISTDYRRDVLGRGVFIDPNTQLVILDLFLSDENQGSYDSAIETVEFLNDHIKGPYFLLIWTRHEEKFCKFKEDCKNIDIRSTDENRSIKNFPLDISVLDFNKVASYDNEKIVDDVIKYIYDYINNIEEKYVNIYCYLKLTKIFQEQSSMFWDILKPKNLADDLTPDSFSTKYNNVLGSAFGSFDKAFNYEKSGKGFLDIHARFLENELTLNHLDYESNNEGLEKKLKEEINAKLITHSFDINEPESGMPGLIYKVDDENINKLGEFLDLFVEKEQNLDGFDQNDELESIYLATFKYKYFKLKGLWISIGCTGDDFDYKILMNSIIDDNNYVKIVNYLNRRTTGLNVNKCSSVNDNLNELLLNNVKMGKLIITPYCDFAHGKKSDVLYLDVLILNGLNHSIKEIRKMFKKNVNIVNLHNGKFIMYIPSQYKLCDLKYVGKELYKFYISKEYVNEIQINVANSISRIGTTIIE